MMAWRDGDDVRLYTRRGYDWSERYPAVVAALRTLKVGSCLIDGELVVCDEAGVSSFERLRSHQHDHTAFLYARSPAGISLCEHLEADGEVVFRHACARQSLFVRRDAELGQEQEPEQPGCGAGGDGGLGQILAGRITARMSPAMAKPGTGRSMVSPWTTTTGRACADTRAGDVTLQGAGVRRSGITRAWLAGRPPVRRDRRGVNRSNASRPTAGASAGCEGYW
jgi:hypothetical protein